MHVNVNVVAVRCLHGEPWKETPGFYGRANYLFLLTEFSISLDPYFIADHRRGEARTHTKIRTHDASGNLDAGYGCPISVRVGSSSAVQHVNFDLFGNAMNCKVAR